MALNKLALIRYKTIDHCLRNRARKWTLEQLIEKVSEALYEYEGIRDGVSKRTLQLDLQTMRSSKLYNAPIVVTDKKYYTYEDPKFTITQSKLTAADLQKMDEVVGILKHLNGFNHFGEMSEIIAKLQDNLQRSQAPGETIIQFESNALLKGLNWIDPLYKAIAARRSLLIDYRSFRARTAQPAIFYPYLLKEYRNRWFLIAKNQRQEQIVTLALDRIEALEEQPDVVYKPAPEIDFAHYFDDVLGVTKAPANKPQKVILEFNHATAPYILTKPLHHSQTVLKQADGKTIVQITVILNFELEREILGFGPSVKVLSPRLLVKRIGDALRVAAELYSKNDDSA